MPVSACFSLALRALHRNRLRSSLTLLGVTIGVAVVITMVALGTGARMSIEQHVKAAGTNQITVVAGNYLRITDDYGSDVIESGGGGEAGDDGLGGLAGGSGVSSAPKSGTRNDRRIQRGMVAGPRHLAAAAGERRGADTDSGRCRRDCWRRERCELPRTRGYGDGGRTSSGSDAVRAAAGHGRRHHVDSCAYACRGTIFLGEASGRSREGSSR